MMIRGTTAAASFVACLLGVATGAVAAANSTPASCRAIEAATPNQSGIEQVCEKPADRKSWGERAFELVGFGADAKSYALVVGVSEFQRGFGGLPTKEDALKMRNFLIDEANFDYVHVLTNGRATKQRIDRLMVDYFPAHLDSNDRFLFYWSGHGVTRPNALGGTVGYLPLTATPEGTYSGMIGMDDVKRWNDVLPAEQSLVLLDACFSGLAGSASKGTVRDLTIEQLAKPSHHLITAGTGEEETIAGDRWGGSLFTAAVIDGLRGAADASTAYERDGVVSVHELMNYVKIRVAVEKADAGWNRAITPQLRDLRDNSGEFFFITAERKLANLEEEDRRPERKPGPADPVGKGAQPGMSPLDPADIMEVQDVLRSLDYDPGPSNGKLGLRTRGSIKKFQRDRGLRETGAPDPLTVAALEAAWADRLERDKPQPSPAAAPPKPEVPLIPVDAMYVVIQKADVRSEPSVGATLAATLKERTEVYVPGKTVDGEWLKVEVHDQVTGYVLTPFLEEKQSLPKRVPDPFKLQSVGLTDKSATAVTQQSAAVISPPKPEFLLIPIEAVYVAVKNANVRAEPSVGSTKVATLPKRTEVYVPGKTADNKWLKVERGGQAIGYVYAPLLEDKESYEARTAVLKAQVPKTRSPSRPRPQNVGEVFNVMPVTYAGKPIRLLTDIVRLGLAGLPDSAVVVEPDNRLPTDTVVTATITRANDALVANKAYQGAEIAKKLIGSFIRINPTNPLSPQIKVYNAEVMVSARRKSGTRMISDRAAAKVELDPKIDRAEGFRQALQLATEEAVRRLVIRLGGGVPKPTPVLRAATPNPTTPDDDSNMR